MRLLITLIAMTAIGCTVSKPTPAKEAGKMVGYFEIPVTDMERATRFYGEVFGYAFTRQTIDGNEMALFPDVGDSPRSISGALAKGASYKPSLDGALLYLQTDDIERILKAANSHGGKTLYPKTSTGNLGFVAEFQDSEGN